MNINFKTGLILFLVIMATCHAGYFQDKNSIKKNQIFISTGFLRPDVMFGLGYQRAVYQNVYLNGIIGFSLVDGGVISLGSRMIWRREYRFRPMALLTFIKTTGFSIQNSETTTFEINGSKVDLESKGTISSSLRGGFQFRVWRGTIVQFTLGWRQFFTNQNIEVTNAENPNVVNDFIDNFEGSGVSIGYNAAWEF